MKFHYHYQKLVMICMVMLFTLIPVAVEAQSIIPIPPHGSVFSGNSRGFWFTAPTDFVITGVRAPYDFNTTAQSVHLVKFNTPPPAWSSTTTDFTTLHYSANVPDTNFIPLNIQINSGDIIGVIAIRISGTGGSQTSYASASGPYNSMIGTYPVTLARLGWQGHINNSQAVDFWTETGNPIGRAEIQYVMSIPTDGELSGFVNLGDSLCSGDNKVEVTLKNNGPNTLSQATIDWEVNGTPQPTYSWSGSIAVNDSATVNLGTYTFQTGISYDITSYLTEVNNDIDTFPQNDTAHITGVGIMPTPSMVLNDTTLAICQGDTAWISGTLSGSPPWSFILKEGTTQHSFTNVTDPSVVIPMTPATSRNYTFELIEDATGCIREDGPLVAVAVQPAPPATITPMGPPAACMGDSVMLMGSVGLDFTYQWFVDGSPIPGADNYILGAKTGGDYTVQVTSPIGCANLSAPYTVYIHPLPQVSLGNDTALLPNHNITLNAGAGFNSYLWSTGETSQTINVDSTGTGIGVKTVWVQVTDNNSCKGSDTVTIEFTPHPAVESYTTDASMQLFPNPTTGKVTLQLDRFTAGQINITLYSVDGSRVYSRQHTVTATQEQITLDLQHLPEGVYLLQSVSAKDGRKGTQSIIIQR